MKKLKILFYFILLSTLILPVAAEASCTWREEIITSDPGAQPTDACKNNGEIRPDLNKNEESCSGPAPASSHNLGYATRYVCCCTAVTAALPVAPKFEIPQLEINIPTVELSKADCTSTPDGAYSCQIPWLAQYIVGLYNYGLAIVGILAAIMLMAGGLMWLVSGGDATRVTQARELIIGSVTGLIILVSAYVLLGQINPNLNKLKSLTVGTIKRLELEIAQSKDNSQATQYKNAACATDAELAAGVDFYATGYYKPTWEDSDNFRCVVAMQCSCPLGQDMTKNCDQLYGKTYPGYHPCNNFPSTTEYCNRTKSGTTPQDGDIAGPSNCSNLPLNSQVCVNGTTYTIKDAGGGIKGRRIDIWSGTDLQKALQVTGVKVLKKGACN